MRLQIAREYNKYFERLIAMLGQIGDILPRFRDYEQLFPSHRRLLYCISDAYLDIITFCEKAKSIFKKNQKWKRSWLPGSVTILRVTWRPFDREFGDILGNIRHHRDLVDREADVSQMWLAKSNMDLAKRIRKGIVLVRKLRSLLKITLLDVKRQRLLKRLSTVDYFKRFKSSQKQRYEGTGAWVMDSSEFNSWFEATTSSGLWCHGIRGCPNLRNLKV